MKTWERIYDVIKKEQPIRAVDIQEKLGITVGQLSGGLSTIRNKGLVVQGENKAYSIRTPDKADELKKEIEKIIESYPVPDAWDTKLYQEMYYGIKKCLEI